MNPTLNEFLESGVLELYVMGATTPQQNQTVEEMAEIYPEVRQEIDAISLAMEAYALAQAVKPRSNVKPLFLATIDYMERMKQGELPVTPPVITPATRPEDFAQWLNRDDMQLPADAENIYAKIIGYTPAATTAIIWVKERSDEEVHEDEHERFLILEGTCNIIAGEETHSLKAGDYYAVPLHTSHTFVVTSDVPCKAILQRLSIN